MNWFLNLLAKPLGWLMWLVYEYPGLHNYFLTMFLFTLLTRIIVFPFSLKNQKSMVDRARLAPRLERIQKKYAKDQQKLQQKQQELYQKEGVSMFAGCLPTIVTMVILFGVIACIYSPLTHLIRIPENVVQSSIAACTLEDGEKNEFKYEKKDMAGYYGEFRMLNHLEENKDDIISAITETGVAEDAALSYYNEMAEAKKEFSLFGHEEWSLLRNPSDGGFSLLWALPLLAGLAQLAMTIMTMKKTKQATSAEVQQAQGCTNVMMYGMPIFSVIIGFSFPAGVSIYWVCSSIIGMFQTWLLYKIYDPVKAREQAEIEYKEKRAKKLADKKRLAEARAHQDAMEQAELPSGDAGNQKALPEADMTPDELEELKKGE